MSEQTDDWRPRVSIHIKAVFHLPKRKTKRRRELCRRIIAAARILSAEAERPGGGEHGGVQGDDCNLADCVNALESLASTVQRMRASAHNRGG